MSADDLSARLAPLEKLTFLLRSSSVFAPCKMDEEQFYIRGLVQTTTPFAKKNDDWDAWLSGIFVL